MKFRNFKDEKELMDFIDPHNEKHRNLMVDYAVSLHERFGMPVEEAVKEVKRLLEAKKNGEEIVILYPEELAFDYKPPFVPVPREREVHPDAGKFTEYEQATFISNYVFKEVSLFHDLEEKYREEMEFYVKDAVEYYSEYYGIDKVKIVESLKALFRKRRKTTPHQYEKYRGKELNRMVGTPSDPDYRKYDRFINNSKRDVRNDYLQGWDDDQK